MAGTPTPNLSLRPAVLDEQKSIATQQKYEDTLVTGTTVNAFTSVYASGTTDRLDRNAGCFILIINTAAVNALNYRVIGRVADAGQDVTLIPSTAIALSSDSGIIKLSPGLRRFNIQIQAAVAGSQTDYEIQVSFVPIGI